MDVSGAAAWPVTAASAVFVVVGGDVAVAASAHAVSRSVTHVRAHAASVPGAVPEMVELVELVVELVETAGLAAAVRCGPAVPAGDALPAAATVAEAAFVLPTTSGAVAVPVATCMAVDAPGAVGVATAAVWGAAGVAVAGTAGSRVVDLFMPAGAVVDRGAAGVVG